MPILYPKGYLLAPQLQSPVRQILSAGNADEEVLADSHFTPLMVEALENADINGDGYVTGVEVMAYVSQKVPQMEKDQNPIPATMPKDSRGDFVFGRTTVRASAPPQQAVPKPQIVTREWRSPELQVDCNRTNSGKIQVSIPLDPAFNEKVVGVSARYDRLDHVKDLTGPTLEGGPGQNLIVSYGFNGEDRILGNCPGGGHATVVVVFQIERTEVPIQPPGPLQATIQ